MNGKSRITKLAKNGKTKTKNENCSWISAVTLSQNYPSGMNILTFPLSHLPTVHASVNLGSNMYSMVAIMIKLNMHEGICYAFQIHLLTRF